MDRVDFFTMTPFWKSPWLRAAVLVAITIAAYAPALRGGFVWDDDTHVTNNPTLRSLEGLSRIWVEPTALPQYYPLVHTTFWIEHHFWGDAPFGYHLVNVLLHALAAVLLLWVLEFLSVPGAWLAAAVFAVHPVHVESVAWVTERKNVLSAVFYLAAALCFLRFFEGSRHRRRWYVAGFGLFVAALLSKTVAASLPAALLIVLWWKRDRWRKAEVGPLLPLFAVGAAMGLATVWLEKHHVGAEGDAWSLSSVARCLVAGRALWFYAGKLCWPSNLTFVYPRWTIDAGVFWQYLFPLAAVAVVAALVRARDRIGKGPAAAILFFAATLFPALGFFSVFPMLFSYVADHFQYLASIGLIAGGAAGATVVARRMGPAGTRTGALAAALLLALFGSLTRGQCRLYKNAETLWRDTLAKNPGAWIADQNLGVLLTARGADAEAESYFRAALAIIPAYAPEHQAITHFALTHALLDQGKLAQASALCREEAERWPHAQLTYENRGVLAVLQGNPDEAARQLNETLRLFPDSVTAHFGLAIILGEAGRHDEASAHTAAVARIVGPEAAARLHDKLGLGLAAQGKAEQAIAEFSESVRLDPGPQDARRHLAAANQRLASVRYARGDAKQAEQLLREALRVLPGYPDAHFALTRVLMDQGKLDDAAAMCREEAASWPADPQTLEDQGLLALQQGNAAEAERWFLETLRRDPGSATAEANLADIYAKAGRAQEASEHEKALARLIGASKGQPLPSSGSPPGSPAPR
jgi:tetratricopeptide (TPR) repeat protein